jgi:hypothetical protein
MPDQCGIQRRPACFQAFDGKVHIGRQMNRIRVIVGVKSLLDS